MKITTNGVEFLDYKSVSPNDHLCSFTDTEGATLLIKTTTLIKMYELTKFDLVKRGTWEFVLKRLNKG